MLTKERLSLFSNWAGKGLGQNLDWLPTALENGLLWVLKRCCPDPNAKDHLIITAIKWRSKVWGKWRLRGRRGPMSFQV